MLSGVTGSMPAHLSWAFSRSPRCPDGGHFTSVLAWLLSGTVVVYSLPLATSSLTLTTFNAFPWVLSHDPSCGSGANCHSHDVDGLPGKTFVVPETLFLQQTGTRGRKQDGRSGP